MSDWILCKDRLPAKGKIVLICDGQSVGMGFMGLHGAKRSRKAPQFFRPILLDCLTNIVAWQALPKPLKVKNG